VDLVQIKGRVRLAGSEHILRASPDSFLDQGRDAIDAAGDGSKWVGDTRLIIIEQGASNTLCRQIVAGGSSQGPFQVPVTFLRPYDCQASLFASQTTKAFLKIGSLDREKAEHGVAAIRASWAALHQRAILGAHQFKCLVSLMCQELISSEEVVDARHGCDSPAYGWPSTGLEGASLSPCDPL
jgi:hypothetical protein